MGGKWAPNIYSVHFVECRACVMHCVGMWEQPLKVMVPTSKDHFSDNTVKLKRVMEKSHVLWASEGLLSRLVGMSQILRKANTLF